MVPVALYKKCHMRKFYPLYLSLILFSCHSTRFEYVGSREAPTNRVDVFVDENAIPRPYLIIGKGYYDAGIWGKTKREKMLAEALSKARKNGADAVYFMDRFIPAQGTQINTQTSIDSLGKGLISRSSTAVNPVYGYWHHEILFLKYR